MLPSYPRRLDRIETHQREDTQALYQRIDAVNRRMDEGLGEVNRRMDAVNQRILWVIGTQIALMGLLLAALKFT